MENILLIISCALPCFILSSLIHELGHLIAGLLQGFKFYLLIAGPFGFNRNDSYGTGKNGVGAFERKGTETNGIYVPYSMINTCVSIMDNQIKLYFFQYTNEGSQTWLPLKSICCQQPSIAQLKNKMKTGE